MTQRYRDFGPGGRNVILPGNVVQPAFDLSGNHRVAWQDATEPMFDHFLTEKLSTATLAVQPVIDDEILVVNAGHTIAVGNFLDIWDLQYQRFTQVEVYTVVGNSIGIAMPIDFAYNPATTIIDVVNNKLNVDGSVTPRLFTFAPRIAAFDMHGIIAIMTHTQPGDDTKFGPLPKLAKGIWSRYATDVGLDFNVWTVRTGGDLRIRSFDTLYTPRSPAGEYSTTWSRKFSGHNNQGLVFRFSGPPIGGRMELYIRDNLTVLTDFRFVLQGKLPLTQVLLD